MPVRRIALALVILGLGACGDGQRVNTDGPTSVPGGVSQPQCVSDLGNNDYDYTADPDDVAGQQDALREDQEAVLAYGKEHPDEFTAIAFDNRPTVIVVGYFTGHLEEHRAALLGRLQHPEKFEVRQSVQSDRDAKAIQEVLQSDPELKGLWGGIGSGTGNGAVSIELHSTRAAREAADRIRSRWGDVVCISVGGHPYPKGAWPDRGSCPDVEGEQDPDVDFVLIPDRDTVARGETGRGVARITNHGSTTLSGITGTDIEAVVVQPGTARVVGRAQVGVTNDAGRSFKVAPGETTEIPIRFGTDDCSPDGDYSLPAGKYGLMTYVKEFGRSDEASLTITEE